MSVKGLEELTEVSLRVVWARRRLGVVLDSENRVLAVPHAFDRTVIEVKVSDLERARAGYARSVAPHREAVVL